MNKSFYVALRQDLFEADMRGMIPQDCNLQVGSIWITFYLTDEEAEKYTYKKEKLD
jgi:hypothetical protein